jgi:hypothetical protein
VFTPRRRFAIWSSQLSSIARAVDGRAICNGNRESFRHVFSPDSIILWHFKSFSRKRRRIRVWEADPTAPEVVRLKSPREVAVGDERGVASTSAAPSQ